MNQQNLTRPQESRSLHGVGLTHRIPLDNPMHRLHRNAQLPIILCLQRRNRANDTRHFQRPRPQWHLRQCRCSGPHRYRALLQGQAGIGAEDDCGIQPSESHRYAGRGGGDDCIFEREWKSMGYGPGCEGEWRDGLKGSARRCSKCSLKSIEVMAKGGKKGSP